MPLPPPLSNEDQMTITRIPRRQTTDIQSEDAFIEGKEAVKAMAKRPNKKTIMLRIDPELLDEITSEARQAGLTRSAWIHSTLTKATKAKS
jgi:predicted HicB family RNase H-like nuclease